MTKDYSKIISNFLKVLPEKQREIISRRFGLKGEKRETLEVIGNNLGITRERVRQIESDAFLKLQPQIEKQQKVFQAIEDYLKKSGGVKKEELLFGDLATKENQIFFLLSILKTVKRFSETESFYPFWAQGKESFASAKKNIDIVYDGIKKSKKVMKLSELISLLSINSNILISSLEISKKILKNQEGFYGLKEWPEVNPRRIKDKAYIALKKNKEPLHFTEVAGLIPASLPQTVHNELIKDTRFVLVGRGIYALNEWGYEKGVVKDVIKSILKEYKKPLTKEQIVQKVQEKRLVKENTILLNLSNRKYFLRDSGGFYDVKTS
ncbi:MAG: sigma factor-like helix-turn-helix DNA-binding protein [Candidatus Nealsonbacteria bacterium]